MPVGPLLKKLAVAHKETSPKKAVIAIAREASKIEIRNERLCLELRVRLEEVACQQGVQTRKTVHNALCRLEQHHRSLRGLPVRRTRSRRILAQHPLSVCAVNRDEHRK